MVQREPVVPGAVLAAARGRQRRGGLRVARMSYRATDGMFQSVDLERHIRRLHRAVGNAIADGKHIVFAAGSVQLINALVYALSPDANAASPPARVVATAPYYPVSSATIPSLSSFNTTLQSVL